MKIFPVVVVTKISILILDDGFWIISAYTTKSDSNKLFDERHSDQLAIFPSGCENPKYDFPSNDSKCLH
jgi:hypothetical protein